MTSCRLREVGAVGEATRWDGSPDHPLATEPWRDRGPLVTVGPDGATLHPGVPIFPGDWVVEFPPVPHPDGGDPGDEFPNVLRLSDEDYRRLYEG